MLLVTDVYFFMHRFVAFFISLTHLKIAPKHVKTPVFHILKFYIWLPWPSHSNECIHFSIVFVNLCVVLNACNTCFLIIFHLPIEILVQNMRNTKFKNTCIMKRSFYDLTLKKNLHPSSNCFHSYQCCSCTPLRKWSKTASKYETTAKKKWTSMCICVQSGGYLLYWW